MARGKKGEVRCSIGRFKTLEEATTAANEARENLHGQFANSG